MCRMFKAECEGRRMERRRVPDKYKEVRDTIKGKVEELFKEISHWLG